MKLLTDEIVVKVVSEFEKKLSSFGFGIDSVKVVVEITKQAGKTA